jgi:hypothetical protein
MYSEIIEEEMYRHYLMRRADASAATPSASSTTSGPGAAAATTAAPVKKPKAPFTLAAPAILQDGTLFYIAVAVTTLLWGTGKAIDIKTERQERYAESLVNSI